MSRPQVIDDEDHRFPACLNLVVGIRALSHGVSGRCWGSVNWTVAPNGLLGEAHIRPP